MIRIENINRCLYLLIVLLVFQFYSCGSSSDLTHVQNFKIDYYTTGGVTGRSNGLTVDSEGQLKFWYGITYTKRNINDSLLINNNDIIKLSQLLEDSTIYNFKYKETGNITTVLKFTSDTGNNTISYSGTIAATSFPHKIKELIGKLNELKNKR